MRERIDLPALPYERENTLAAVTRLQEQMGEEQFATHWRAGRRLSIDEATELVLSRERLQPLF